MADTKFSQFSNAVTLTGAEKVVGLQGGNNVQIQLSTLMLPYINSNTQLSSTSQVAGLDTALASKLNLSGSNGPMTGLFSLSGDPVSNLQPTTKQYVDGLLATKLNISGGALTGPVTAAADPTVPLGLATKQYVDNSSSADTFQTVYNNSSPPEFKVSSSGFTITDPSSVTLFNLGTSDGINFYAQLKAQVGVSLVSLTDGSLTSFTSGNILNHFHADAGVNNPNFTFTAQSEIPSSLFANCGNYQFGFSDESASPSGFFKLNLMDSGVNNNILYASGTTSSAPPLISINSQLRVGPPFSPTSANVKLLVNGSDSSGTDAPGMGFFTNTDGYPLLQILPATHGVVLLNFDCYSASGTYRSSYAGSNFQIAKSNNQLQFNYRSGISPGSTFAFQQAGYIDNSGNFNFILGLILGQTQSTVQRNLLTLMGSDSSVNNCTNFYTNFDQYPLFQIEPYAHNTVNLNLDCYYNGINFLSSNTTSNFQINKNTNLKFNCASGVSQGGVISWITGMFISPSGQINLPLLSPSSILGTDSGNNIISIPGGGTPYTEVTGTSQAMSVNNEYTANNAALVTLSLPVTANAEDEVIVNGKGAGGWKIAQNAGQIIHLGSRATTSGTGGSISSTNQWDNVKLKCVTTNTTWIVQGGPMGNLNVI